MAINKTCTIRRGVLVDVRVKADVSGLMWRTHFDSEEEHAKALERAVKDFTDFLRDHRSQDLVQLNVERIYKNLCSECGKEFERDFDEETKLPFCAFCGADLMD